MKKNHLVSIIEHLFIFSLALFVLLGDGHEVTFHIDESHWIGTSIYFDALLEGDFSPETWKITFDTLTQPPVTRYVIGIGRLLGGQSTAALNTIWDYMLSREDNIAAGAIPSNELLYWSRLPMRVLASFSILIGFFVLRRVGGRIPGYLWVVLCLTSQYLLLHLSRAMSESPVLWFVTLILLVSYLILNHVSQLQKTKSVTASPPQRRVYGYFAVLGLMIGLAGSAKLNGLSAMAAEVTLAVMVVCKSRLSKTLKFRYALIFIWIMVIAVLGVFIAINPLLWRETIGRCGQLILKRIYEMYYQYLAYGQTRITGLSARIRVVGGAIFKRNASLQFFGSLWVNLALTLVGLYYAIRQLVAFVRGRDFNPAALSILIVSFATAGPSLLTPQDWDRYYMFPVFFATMLICIGVWQGVLLIQKVIKNKKSKRQPDMI